MCKDSPSTASGNPIDELTKDILSKIKRPKPAAEALPVEPNANDLALARISAEYLNAVTKLLPGGHEAIRRAVASMIHPEGAQERRGLSTNPLTRLPDKSSFLSLVEIFGKNPLYAIVSMDADGLKLVNDNVSHPAGDAYLIGIGHSISSAAVQFGDNASNIFHLSGDEFAAFVPMARAKEFIALVNAEFEKYMDQAEIENGRREDPAPPQVVLTSDIRDALGSRKPGISTGYGPTEADAERMLKINKGQSRRAVPLDKIFADKIRGGF